MVIFGRDPLCLFFKKTDLRFLLTALVSRCEKSLAGRLWILMIKSLSRVCKGHFQKNLLLIFPSHSVVQLNFKKFQERIELARSFLREARFLDWTWSTCQS